MLASLGEFFAFGAIGFWLFVALFTGLFFAFLNSRKSVVASITFLAGIFLAYKLGVPVLRTLWQNPGDALLWALYYFLAGAVWSVARWGLYVWRKKRKYREALGSFLRQRGVRDGKLQDHLKSQWLEWVKDTREFRVSKEDGVLPPSPGDHKEEIYMWILLWPWSMAYFILEDPLVRIVRFIYNQLVGVYERISKAAFADTKNDFN